LGEIANLAAWVMSKTYSDEEEKMRVEKVGPTPSSRVTYVIDLP
jgi:hypothetical protein